MPRDHYLKKANHKVGSNSINLYCTDTDIDYASSEKSTKPLLNPNILLKFVKESPSAIEVRAQTTGPMNQKK